MRPEMNCSEVQLKQNRRQAGGTAFCATLTHALLSGLFSGHAIRGLTMFQCFLRPVLIAASMIWASSGHATTPVPRPCPSAASDGIACFEAKDENGAFVLIARPANWNGALIVHIFGGPRMRVPDASMTDEDLVRFVEMVREGYAWVASSRRRGGFGVTLGAEDADNSRKLYVAAFGEPRMTIVHGQSWGANIGAILIEKFNAPDQAGRRPYHGALLTSGVLAGATRGYDARVDLRAAFQLVCKTHPRADETPYHLGIGLPEGVKLSHIDLIEQFNACTGANRKVEERSDEQKRALADLAAASRIPAGVLLGHLQPATFVFRDIADFLTGGKPPFGNIGVVYKGTSDDKAFNLAVPRFAADESAVKALAEDSNPTGKFDVPVVTMHAIRDTTVFVEQGHEYRRVAEAAGRGALLMQSFVDDNLHAKMSPPHYPAVLGALKTWIETAQRPSIAAIVEACEISKAKYAGECKFLPDYQSKPFYERVNARSQ
jgi:hypothetical protein